MKVKRIVKSVVDKVPWNRTFWISLVVFLACEVFVLSIEAVSRMRSFAVDLNACATVPNRVYQTPYQCLEALKYLKDGKSAFFIRYVVSNARMCAGYSCLELYNTVMGDAKSLAPYVTLVSIFASWLAKWIFGRVRRYFSRAQRFERVMRNQGKNVSVRPPVLAISERANNDESEGESDSEVEEKEEKERRGYEEAVEVD